MKIPTHCQDTTAGVMETNGKNSSLFWPTGDCEFFSACSKGIFRHKMAYTWVCCELCGIWFHCSCAGVNPSLANIKMVSFCMFVLFIIMKCKGFICQVRHCIWRFWELSGSRFICQNIHVPESVFCFWRHAEIQWNWFARGAAYSYRVIYTSMIIVFKMN